MGFADDYTLVPYRGKPAADGPRYKALGNSMAVPVMRWIGRRIAAVDRIEDDDARRSTAMRTVPPRPPVPTGLPVAGRPSGAGLHPSIGAADQRRRGLGGYAGAGGLQGSAP